MNLALATQHLASPARPVSLRSLLAACAKMTKPLPVGSYCLGEADADGLPIVAKPHTRVALAATDESLELLLLGVTAVASALRLSNQTGVNIITTRAATWATWSNATISAPGEKPHVSAGSHNLFVLDDAIEIKRWTSPQVIEALTALPAASVLVLTKPDHAKKLEAALPVSYKQDGGTLPYLRLLYGQGSQHLTRLSGLPVNFEIGQFAARIQSNWLMFTTANRE